MKIAITTDQNSGFSFDRARELGVFMVHMPVMIDGVTYLEGVDLEHEDFIQAMREGRTVSTSQQPPKELMDLFQELLAQGYEEVVHIPMTKALSGSYQTATQLARSISDRIYVVDNGRISVTQEAAIYDALDLVAKGYSGREIHQILEANKLESVILLGVDTLKYLHQGGRLPTAAALIGKVLNIKPLLRVKDGFPQVIKKARSLKKCQQEAIKVMGQELASYVQEGTAFRLGIAGTLDPARAQAWLDLAQEGFPDREIHYQPLPLSVAAHLGPDAFGIAMSKVLDPFY